MRAPPPLREAPQAKEAAQRHPGPEDAGGPRAAPAPSSRPREPANGAIPLLKPDDTGTREALKDAVTSNAAVLFAVQLQWSVQAVELEKVPPLAIFSAYTLYTVEGSRDGRKWYGLRLGFFSDAISAKQVAHYVRSEFALGRGGAGECAGESRAPPTRTSRRRRSVPRSRPASRRWTSSS